MAIKIPSLHPRKERLGKFERNIIFRGVVKLRCNAFLAILFVRSLAQFCGRHAFGYFFYVEADRSHKTINMRVYVAAEGQEEGVHQDGHGGVLRSAARSVAGVATLQRVEHS